MLFATIPSYIIFIFLHWYFLHVQELDSAFGNKQGKAISQVKQELYVVFQETANIFQYFSFPYMNAYKNISQLIVSIQSCVKHFCCLRKKQQKNF